jgi:hypothetical protein
MLPASAIAARNPPSPVRLVAVGCECIARSVSIKNLPQRFHALAGSPTVNTQKRDLYYQQLTRSFKKKENSVSPKYFINLHALASKYRGVPPSSPKINPAGGAR